MSKKSPKFPKSSVDTDEMTVVEKIKSPLAQPKAKTKFTIILTVLQGSEIDFGKTYHFSHDCIRIGRNPKKNTLAINDQKVSKTHCEICLLKVDEKEHIVIKDLGSTNGTYVNSELVQQRILTPGDKISIGESVLRFSYNDDIEEEYHSKLFTFAATDALTGLYNRRYIFNELENQGKIAKRNNRVFSLVMVDIDDFKQVNDRYGHPAGDEYLKKLTSILNQTLREQDILGRVGGEEFLIILPETDIDGALRLAERIREQVREAELNYQGHSIKTTVSAGVSQFESAGDSRLLFQSVDLALIKAKQLGKDQVVKAAASESPPGEPAKPDGPAH